MSASAPNPYPESVRTPQVQAAAARLRVSLDRKRGLVTPDWIRELAKYDDDDSAPPPTA